MNSVDSKKSFDNRDHGLLYIPVETKVREFTAKLLLGCYAAEAGFKVVIGEQVELLRRIKSMPPGIYLEKGLAPTKLKSIELLRKLGNRVVSWCEEGLVILNKEVYARDRVSKEVASKLDIILAWGNVQAGALKLKIPDIMEHTVLTGNPRFDLLREPYRSIFLPETEAIHAKYGKLILINTNFGMYNSFYGKDFFISKMMHGHGRIVDSDHRRFLNDWVDHVGRTFRHFIEMIRRLSSDFHDYRIIVRPHPSEDHEAWREKTKTLPNVSVVHEGNVIPWILASDVLVHNSCTTGVEAYALGKPVVSYRPIVSREYEPELPWSLSTCTFTEDELVDTLKRMIKGTEKGPGSVHSNADVREMFKQYVESTDGSFACEKIVAAVGELAGKLNERDSEDPVTFLDKAYWLIKDYGSMTRMKINRMIKGRSSDSVYRHQKFPGLTLKEMHKAVERFQNVNDGFACLRVRRLNGTRTCFQICSE